MKRLLTTICMTLCLAQGHAQDSHQRLQNFFNDFRREAHEEFNSFRRQCMAEYLSFLADPWKEFNAEQTVPVPHDETVPPAPPVRPHDDEQPAPVDDTPVEIDEVVTPAPVPPQPQPVAPIEEERVEEMKYVDFKFYGTLLRVRFDKADCVRLNQLSEQAAADALNRMSQRGYDNLLIDCLALRDELHLCDWAYVQMAGTLAQSIADGRKNDAALLQAYVLLQSGYRCRLGMDASRLYILVASPYIIFDYNCYRLDGILYYGLEPLPSSMYISEAGFRQERTLSLSMQQLPQLSQQPGQPRTLASQSHPSVSATVTSNENIIRFLGDYPRSEYGGDVMTQWATYANTPLDANVAGTLYPALQRHIEGKGQVEAVGVLLEFVQQTIIYGYDDELWGGDRPFFADETLYYPYGDCEDHAILFARLVRDLLGLNVVLVYYPGHLATAVELTAPSAHGDYLELNGRRFFVCDPTSSEPVGRTRSDMDNRKAKVIMLR